MGIQPIGEAHRQEVNSILLEEWAAPPVISRGRAIDTTNLPGYVFLRDGAVQGVVTYQVENGGCEIVTLNSLMDYKGIGTALTRAVIQAAGEQGCKRVWLITTNDNTRAIRFYQRQGFDLAAAHIGSIAHSRRLKPSIPLRGIDGIPIRHELEFELRLTQAEH